MEMPKQCTTIHVIPSLLFRDCYFPINLEITENVYDQKENIQQRENNRMMDILETPIILIPKNENVYEGNETEKLSSELHDIKQKYSELKENINVIQSEFVKVNKPLLL